ncbi:MAG: sulfate adenylyltransferase subunit CysN [Helicobacteraceae bacterium]|jgi:sulfate adenylyltransferase subunit 1|nr:sulfate adenylyltransferase subunit CysN [Helicobacteraceae bacterium]
MPRQTEKIESYLKDQEQKELLRFIACGSVDDGKSTLIGRLLHDSKTLYEDQIAALKEGSKKGGAQDDELDLSLLVDGLQAELEQKITIDVAYRYFSTKRRKFIVADTPGHEQYTRNMATGASSADLAIILIDATKGVSTQTKRHSYIVHLLGVDCVAVAINKMDAIGYERERYEAIAADYAELAAQIGIKRVAFFPVSALKGDNIVSKSENTKWFDRTPLMEFLETVEIARGKTADFRFPVQLVVRPDRHFRGFAGTIASGVVRAGDPIRVLPSGAVSRIARIVTYDGDLQSARTDMAVTLTLTDEIDVSRGDTIVKEGEEPPQIASDFEADLVWLGEEPLGLDKSYLIKIGTKTMPANVTAIKYLIDVNSLKRREASQIALNSICRVSIAALGSLVFDPYDQNRATGGFILIDRFSNATVAAGMIRAKAQSAEIAFASKNDRPNAFEIELNALIRKHFPHWRAKDISQNL